MTTTLVRGRAESVYANVQTIRLANMFVLLVFNIALITSTLVRFKADPVHAGRITNGIAPVRVPENFSVAFEASAGVGGRAMASLAWPRACWVAKLCRFVSPKAIVAFAHLWRHAGAVVARNGAHRETLAGVVLVVAQITSAGLRRCTFPKETFWFANGATVGFVQLFIPFATVGLLNLLWDVLKHEYQI